MSKYTETVNNSKAITDNYTVKKEKISGITVYMYIPKEKKEKDMKETNLEHYKEDLKEILTFTYNSPKDIIKHIGKRLGCQIKVKSGEYVTDAILEWMAQPYEKPILDDKEREYLSEVIKPYRNKVTFIAKSKDSYEAKYFISIVVKGNYGREAIHLPWFKENTMYKGMELSKKYTVEELGL